MLLKDVLQIDRVVLRYVRNPAVFYCEKFMNELIKIVNHAVLVKAVDARELHAKLEIKAQFSNWIQLQIERADLKQGVDFITINNNITSPPSKEFIISVDAGKNIAMLSQTEKGKEVRAYFIECEKKLKAFDTPKTFSEALRLAADLQDQLALTSEKLEIKTIQLDEAKEWLSIKRVAKENGKDWKHYNWAFLKRKSMLMEKPPQKVFDANYGQTNVYHLSVWVECYPEDMLAFETVL